MGRTSSIAFAKPEVYEYLEEQRELREAEIARRIRVARLKRQAELTAVCEALFAELEAGESGEAALAGLPRPQTAMAGVDNAGNTCYLDSLLFAMFATSEALEYLLYPSPHLELGKPVFNPFAFDETDSDSDSDDAEAQQAAKVKAIRTLQFYLREHVVRRLRNVEFLDANAMELTRFMFRWAGWESGEDEGILFGWDGLQQDTAELLDNALDWLGAPYIACVRRFALRGMPDPESAAVERFRTIRVSMPQKIKKRRKQKRKRDRRFSLGYMLDQDLNNNPLEGFKREPSAALLAALEAADDAVAGGL